MDAFIPHPPFQKMYVTFVMLVLICLYYIDEIEGCANVG